MLLHLILNYGLSFPPNVDKNGGAAEEGLLPLKGGQGCTLEYFESWATAPQLSLFKSLPIINPQANEKIELLSDCKTFAIYGSVTAVLHRIFAVGFLDGVLEVVFKIKFFRVHC
jgi:hypothetical protein